MKRSLRKVRRTLALFLFACASAHVAALAQGGRPRAHKIDETENTRCDLAEVAQVTDAGMPVFAALEEHPRARVAVVVYAPQPGDALSYARQVRLWLTEVRGVPAERLLDLYGGPAERRRLELWLVPAGAEPPTAVPPVARVGVTLFERYTYWGGEFCPPERVPALEVFAETLKRLPGWRGTLVLRPHVNRRRAPVGGVGWDASPLSRREALRRAAADRLYLVRQLGLTPSRIRAVVGASDSWAHAELWLIPPSHVVAKGGL